MPTARGWLTAGTGATLLVAGRFFGAGPVEQVGMGLLALVTVAVVVVRTRGPRLEVTRTLSPERCAAGHLVTVTVHLANSGERAAPLLLLDDRLPFEFAGGARFAVNGVEPAGSRTVAYQIRPPRRGRYEIGPLHVSFVDPFGLARQEAEGAASASFLVHPGVETLSIPRTLGERRSVASSAIRQPTGSRGEDFFTMREYVEGDDLRRIHWPSTAKRGKPMIRQEETPWQTRATVIFDDRAAAHEGYGDSSSFERTVDASAALADLFRRSGYSFRLTGANEPGLSPGKGTEHMNRCLDLLAVARLHVARGDVDPLLARLNALSASSMPQGSLVLITGRLSDEVGVALGLCFRRFREVTVICFPAHRFGAATTKDRWAGEGETYETMRMLTRSGVRPIVLGPGESLGAAWAATPRRARSLGESTWDRKPAPA
jgi:uncharacterized protein (DUF58 family)